MIIGDRVKNLLRMRGFSQTQLADKLGISLARLNNYLNGRSEPTMILLCKIADNLNTSVDFILGRVDEPTNNQITAENSHDFQIVPFIDNKYNVKILINSVPVYNSLTAQDKSPCIEKPCKWVYVNNWIGKQNDIYGVIAQDNCLAPNIIKNDLAIVENCEILPSVVNSDQVYVFRRSVDDNIGLMMRFAYCQDNVLIANSLQNDYPPLIFDLKHTKSNPISGKVVAVFRTIQ